MELHTLCPECGPDVHVDEDGCCVNCGADAVGRGVEVVREHLRKLKTQARNARARSRARIRNLKARLVCDCCANPVDKFASVTCSSCKQSSREEHEAHEAEVVAAALAGQRAVASPDCYFCGDPVRDGEGCDSVHRYCRELLDVYRAERKNGR